MNITVFVSIWMTAFSSVALNDHFLGEPLSFLKSDPKVNAVEYYSPYEGDFKRMDDIPAPHLIVEIRLNSQKDAEALTGSEAFKKHFIDKEGVLAGASKINLEVLEAVHFDIPGHKSPPPRTAPYSFVVRYYGPVEDGGDFTDFYTKNHPPLLANFPEVRNVLCYLPIGWRDRGALGKGELIHGNEVVFDNMQDFQAAIKSDAMGPVMADSKLFKPYGYSSHHAMHRKLVYQR